MITFSSTFLRPDILATLTTFSSVICMGGAQSFVWELGSDLYGRRAVFCMRAETTPPHNLNSSPHPPLQIPKSFISNLTVKLIVFNYLTVKIVIFGDGGVED